MKVSLYKKNSDSEFYKIRSPKRFLSLYQFFQYQRNIVLFDVTFEAKIRVIEICVS